MSISSIKIPVSNAKRIIMQSDQKNESKNWRYVIGINGLKERDDAFTLFGDILPGKKYYHVRNNTSVTRVLQQTSSIPLGQCLKCIFLRFKSALGLMRKQHKCIHDTLEDSVRISVDTYEKIASIQQQRILIIAHSHGCYVAERLYLTIAKNNDVDMIYLAPPLISKYIDTIHVLNRVDWVANAVIHHHPLNPNPIIHRFMQFTKEDCLNHNAPLYKEYTRLHINKWF